MLKESLNKVVHVKENCKNRLELVVPFEKRLLPYVSKAGNGAGHKFNYFITYPLLPNLCALQALSRFFSLILSSVKWQNYLRQENIYRFSSKKDDISSVKSFLSELTIQDKKTFIVFNAQLQSAYNLPQQRTLIAFETLSRKMSPT